MSKENFSEVWKKKALKEEKEEFMKSDDDTNPGSFLFGCMGKWRVLPCVVCKYFSVLVKEVPNFCMKFETSITSPDF